MFYKSLSSILRKCDCIMFSRYPSSSSPVREKSAKGEGPVPTGSQSQTLDCIFIMMPKRRQKE